MKPTSKPKVYVFIDGSNVFYSQKHIGWGYDWKKILKYLKNKYNIKKVMYYTGIKDDDTKMQNFLDKLKKYKFNVYAKPLKIIHGDKQTIIYKSNCDIEIAVDIILKQDKYDILILFSGDSDFVYVIKKLQRLYSKKVYIYSTRKTISWEIKLAADKYTLLEDLRKEIEYKKNLRPKAEYCNTANILQPHRPKVK